MIKSTLKALTFAATLCAAQTFAAPVLVSEYPWGSNADEVNMANVFGAGNFDTYTSYAAAGSIFNAGNSFVMLEGGASTDVKLASFLAGNEASIFNWVAGGGALLIQSAGWNTPISFGSTTLGYPAENYCGQLTSEGEAAFATTASYQCGSYLAHNTVTGTGLTTFMVGTDNGEAIVAGSQFGAGYIMFSGLTNSQFHSSGYSLVDEVIGYTAKQGSVSVPEPSSILLMGLGLLGLGLARRKTAK